MGTLIVEDALVDIMGASPCLPSGRGAEHRSLVLDVTLKLVEFLQSSMDLSGMSVGRWRVPCCGRACAPLGSLSRRLLFLTIVVVVVWDIGNVALEIMHVKHSREGSPAARLKLPRDKVSPWAVAP